MFSKTDIEKYFIAEKSASLLILIIGIVAILLALLFFFYMKTDFYKGLALPLFVIAILQIAVGSTVYNRSDADRKRIVYSYDLNPDALSGKEIPRMEKVNRSFVVYKWIGIILLMTGCILILIFRVKSGGAIWYGIGVGLALQASIMLCADFFAEKRAKEYTIGLKKVTQKL